MLGAIVMTLALTAGLAFLIASTDIEAIKGNWDTRRCEVPIQLSAYLFKPDADPRTPSQFASDNFAFCTKEVVNSVLQIAFAPLYAVAGQQTNAVAGMQGPLNSVRSMLTNAKNTFSKYMDKQYRQFSVLTVLATKTWQHLLFAMGRVQAMVLSVVYIGLSLSATVQMTLQFILKVISIFIGILAAMIILLFFVLFPFMPMILSMIVVLTSVGLASAGMAGAFCIDPEARIQLADGSVKALKDIKLGDKLQSMTHSDGTNRVEGVLRVDATSEPLVVLNGVLLSKSHRVYHDKKWILAYQHPDAIATTRVLPELICLNTTEHSVPVVGLHGCIYAGDWEEVDTEQGRKAWIQWVHLKLNGGHHNPSLYPTAVPLVSLELKVRKEGVGWVPIKTIQIGDSIYGNGHYTKVKGLYSGELQVEEVPTNPEWISDGVWILREGRFWSPTASGVQDTEDGTKTVQGLYLVTENGYVNTYRYGKQELLRDFTEVGMAAIEQSYTMLDTFLRKK